MDIRRFGVGHRRPEWPAGTTGIEGQLIESGPAGLISELAFSRHARIVPHTNPNAVWFVVIEGGGWVGVGEERARVQAGEAVAWPPDVLHAAWTDGTQMRALIVEFMGPVLALPDGRIQQLTWLERIMVALRLTNAKLLEARYYKPVHS